MIDGWTPKETSNHQDHVIAHVLGATLLGYFVFDEALYILLDIGFIWTILLDGEMGLLPHPVAVSELEVDAQTKAEIKADVDRLLGVHTPPQLLRFQSPPVQCQIKEVNFFSKGEERRFVITCEEDSLVIKTSLATAKIQVMTLEDEQTQRPAETESEDKLETVAQTEHAYLHQRLREDLGREPTEEELDEWLRQHTEGY